MDAWKKTVDVQMHFNDLSLRLRSFAITILLGALGAAGLAMKERLVVHFWDHNFSLAALLLIAGVLGWIACYTLDRFGYHRLLVGAVEHGTRVEAKLRLAVPEAALTAAIGSKSALDWGFAKIKSHRKIDFFYGVPTVALLGMAAIVWSPEAIVGPTETSKEAPLAAATASPSTSPVSTVSPTPSPSPQEPSRPIASPSSKTRPN